jgi:hypothetical protein
MRVTGASDAVAIIMDAATAAVACSCTVQDIEAVKEVCLVCGKNSQQLGDLKNPQRLSQPGATFTVVQENQGKVTTGSIVMTSRVLDPDAGHDLLTLAGCNRPTAAACQAALVKAPRPAEAAGCQVLPCMRRMQGCQQQGY